MYNSTHIISSRDTTGYAEFPMPRSYPDFPSRDQMLAYLRSYAEAFSLRELIRFRTEVTSLVPVTPDGVGGWDATMRLPDGTVVTRRYAGVAVCNGHHWDRRIPTRPGTFSGLQIHSKDYRNPSDFQGSRVLVVGAGNSGCDIAVEASRHFGHSLISMRRGYHFLPKTVLGIPAAELDLPWLPLWAQRAFLGTMVRVIHGSNERYGIPDPDHRLFDRHPVVNSEMLHALRHGRVEYRPDIERFDGNTVIFIDGRREEVDTIVWATGFAVSFPFLDRDIFEWENGIPKRVFGMLPPTAGEPLRLRRAATPRRRRSADQPWRRAARPAGPHPVHCRPPHRARPRPDPSGRCPPPRRRQRDDARDRHRPSHPRRVQLAAAPACGVARVLLRVPDAAAVCGAGGMTAELRGRRVLVTGAGWRPGRRDGHGASRRGRQRRGARPRSVPTG